MPTPQVEVPILCSNLSNNLLKRLHNNLYFNLLTKYPLW